jgi:hypothetical protein
MARKRGPGRPRTTYERLLARLPKGTLRRIELALEGREKQADFARTAFENELARRKARRR